MVGGTWGVAVTAGGGLILASLLACGGKTEAEPMAQPDRAPPGFWPSQADGVILPRFGGQSDYAAITDTCIFNSNSIGLT